MFAYLCNYLQKKSPQRSRVLFLELKVLPIGLKITLSANLYRFACQFFSEILI